MKGARTVASRQLSIVSPPLASPRLALPPAQGVGRRELLRASSGLLFPVAAAPLMLRPTPGMATNAWMSLLLSGATALFNFLFGNESPLFAAIRRWMGGTEMVASQGGAPNDLHRQHSYGVEWSGRTNFSAVNAQTYAGIDRLPKLSVAESGTTGHDLNWAEINNIVADRRVPTPELSGQDVVRGYVGIRRPMVERDQNHFYGTVQRAAMQDSSLPRTRLDVAYVRDVCTCDGVEARGYAFRDANGRNPLDTHFRLYRA